MNTVASKDFVARRANRSQRLDDIALPLLRQRFGRQLTTAQALRMDWPAIVGEEVAACCQLASLSRTSTSNPAAAAAKTAGKSAGKSYAKGVQGGAQGGLNLTLVVEPAFALDIGYQLPQLQQRINGYFGYPAVAAIRLKQQPLASTAMAPNPTGQPRQTARRQPSTLPPTLQPLPTAAANLPTPLAEALQSLQYHIDSRSAESLKP
ncbi:MAG: DciA family protein [Holosporaceae bacterium]|nr:DUF721 domain-containing protein [Rhodospirillaceae bacterium]